MLYSYHMGHLCLLNLVLCPHRVHWLHFIVTFAQVIKVLITLAFSLPASIKHINVLIRTSLTPSPAGQLSLPAATHGQK